MAANTQPLFVVSPKVKRAVVTSSYTANTKSDGTATAVGTDIILLYTAGANGSYIDRIRLMPQGSTAGTATTATVARVYTSSVTSGATTNANTVLISEQTLASITSDSSSAANAFTDIPIGSPLTAGETILLSMHAAPAANTSWGVTVFGGDY